MSPLPKGSVTQCQERLSQPVISPRGKVKVEWAPCFPSLVRHCQRSQLLFQPTQVTEVISIAKYFGGVWGKRKEVDTHRSHHVDLKNQLQILLGGLWTLPRDPSMNTMGLLTCTYPYPLNWLTNAPNTLYISWSDAYKLLQMADASICTVCRYQQLAQLCKNERRHIILNVPGHHLGENKQEALSTQTDFMGSREDTKS